jgi:hypothetical protein
MIILETVQKQRKTTLTRFLAQTVIIHHIIQTFSFSFLFFFLCWTVFSLMDRTWKVIATWALILLLGVCWIEEVLSSCVSLNFCNGHGKCNIYDKCECYAGWGAITDITMYKSLDCSTRTCPAGKIFEYCSHFRI